MSKKAVIQLAGHQYFVANGDQITIDQHLDEKTKTLKVDEVLLIIDGEKTHVGTPNVKGATVSLKVDDLKRGPKVTINRFKAKSRYRRRSGHRQPQTLLTVTSIDSK